MTKVFDDDFANDLANAVVGVMKRLSKKVGAVEVDALAFDVHPRSGFLNISIRLSSDRVARTNDQGIWRIADWKHSLIAVAHHEATHPDAWVEATELARAMRVEFELDPTAARFYGLVARAATRAKVWKAIRFHFTLGERFMMVVPDADSPERVLRIER